MVVGSWILPATQTHWLSCRLEGRVYVESEVEGIRGEAGRRKRRIITSGNLCLDTASEKDACAANLSKKRNTAICT